MAIIAVSALSFSRNTELRSLLKQSFPDWQLRFCESAHELEGDGLQAFLADAQLAIVGKEKISLALLRALPELRLISKYGVGLDNIDFAACQQQGVKVVYRPGVNRQAVAEFTIGLMLAVLRNISLSDRHLRQGCWQKDGGEQLSGKTVAIIGCGAIGSQVARLLQAFACPLILCDLLDLSPFARPLAAVQKPFAEAVALADVVSLHVPLSPTTYHMVNRQSLEGFKKGGVLINTSRGEVVEEEALLAALKRQHLRGAALDVYAQEPPKSSKFSAFPQLVTTPHIAGNAREAVLAMGIAAIDGLRDFLLASQAEDAKMVRILRQPLTDCSQ